MGYGSFDCIASARSTSRAGYCREASVESAFHTVQSLVRAHILYGAGGALAAGLVCGVLRRSWRLNARRKRPGDTG